MSKPSRKRYWKNWNELIVPTTTVVPDFHPEIKQWAIENKIPFVIRTGSRKVDVEMDNGKRTWTTQTYESFYRLWFKHKKDATLFTMTWL